MVLRVGGGLQHGVGAQEPLQAGGVGAPVHVDEAGLAAGAIALCIKCLRCAVAVRIGAPSTPARYAPTPVLKGGKRLLGAICSADGHMAKVEKYLYKKD